MATPSLKRKRDFQEIEYDTDDDFSPFVFGTCGLSMKRRRKNVKPPLPFPKIEKDLNQVRALMQNKQLSKQLD